jgi:hypothetical protein
MGSGRLPIGGIGSGNRRPPLGLPTASLVVEVLELAELFGWPRAAIPPDTTVGPGRAAWMAWVAHADRRQLAAALGVTVVWVHQAPDRPIDD